MSRLAVHVIFFHKQACSIDGFECQAFGMMQLSFSYMRDVFLMRDMERE